MALPSQTRIVTFKIDPMTLELVDAAARKLRVTRSELIRNALLHYLELLGIEPPYNIEVEGEPLNPENLEVDLIEVPPIP